MDFFARTECSRADVDILADIDSDDLATVIEHVVEGVELLRTVAKNRATLPPRVRFQALRRFSAGIAGLREEGWVADAERWECEVYGENYDYAIYGRLLLSPSRARAPVLRKVRKPKRRRPPGARDV